jgi:F-type H+-transporting ATPase subunit a
MPCKIYKGLVFAMMLLLLGSGLNKAWSQEHPAPETAVSAETHESNPEAAEAFKPGDFIFDHINDAHEWHVSKNLIISLPVIVYSKNNGFNVFMSRNFRHGHAEYKGFRLETSGPKKGKVVDVAGGYVLDLSITKNIASLFLGFCVLMLIFLTIGKAYRKSPVSAPRGLQSWIEPIIIFLRDDVIKPSVGPRYEQYTPYLLTLFFFIWTNNMLGLIPIPPAGANLGGNIAVTMVLAIFTFVITNVSANKNYWRHTLNTPGVPAWLKLPIPIMPLVEVLGVFTKPLVLMIRLFANITAGHIVIMGFITLIYIFAQMSAGLAFGVSLITVAFNVFITFLELLVAFIQAFIFTFLSSIYIGLAIAEDHHEEKKEHA